LYFCIFVILLLIPLFGGDIEFLSNTPHAKIPVLIMVPWVIMVIAMAVELNFRGFLLGRLLILFCRGSQERSCLILSVPDSFRLFGGGNFRTHVFF